MTHIITKQPFNGELKKWRTSTKKSGVTVHAHTKSEAIALLRKHYQDTDTTGPTKLYRLEK